MIPSESSEHRKRYVADDFTPALSRFDLGELDEQRATIYGLRRDYTIGYANRTWFRFAAANLAPPELSNPDQFDGPAVTDWFYGPLRDYYREKFDEIVADGNPHRQDYHCSSPDEFRIFHMEILPLSAETSERIDGFLLVNSVRFVDDPEHHFDVIEQVDPSNYVTEEGLIVACSNCRRFRHCTIENRWDWIPAYLEEPPARVSHGICPVCLDYYYRPIR